MLEPVRCGGFVLTLVIWVLSIILGIAMAILYFFGILPDLRGGIPYVMAFIIFIALIYTLLLIRLSHRKSDCSCHENLPIGLRIICSLKPTTVAGIVLSLFICLIAIALGSLAPPFNTIRVFFVGTSLWLLFLSFSFDVAGYAIAVCEKKQ